MATPNTSAETTDWRKSILSQLQNRNKQEFQTFNDLISLHNRLFETVNILRNEKLELFVENETLRRQSLEIQQRSSVCDGKPSDRVQLLEQKLLLQQEELTELHRRKGENAQHIIDLNKKLQDKEKQLAALEVSLADSLAINGTLRVDIQLYQNKIKELENMLQLLRDEHQALQLTCASLEEKLRKTQEENNTLVERLIRYKSKDAEKMNEENENFVRKRQAKLQKELEEAAKDTRPISPDVLGDAAATVLGNVLPTKLSVKIDSHEGEVHAVKWSPVDRIVATGGADRKVKLWDVSKVGQFESKGMLVGSNAAVMSVDFDCTGSLLLGASSDFASRVWTVSDQRLRHTLTGHSGKVMAAKFLGEPTKVVSGSYDRTLKIWDLRSKACVETKFAGSSCNDLVTWDGSGATIISGHFDQRLRLWDARAECSANSVLLQGKITSLDISKDGKYLLACTRDDSLKLLDLRMNQVISSFGAENFRVVCDWARAAFSADGRHAAAGSADGSVLVWSVASGQLEHTLQEHGSSGVAAVSFHPHGSFMASVDRTRKAVIWTEM